MRTGVTVDRGLSNYLKTDLFNGIAPNRTVRPLARDIRAGRKPDLGCVRQSRSLQQGLRLTSGYLFRRRRVAGDTILENWDFGHNPRTLSYPIGTRRPGDPGNASTTSPEIIQATPCTFAASSIRAAMLIVFP